MLNKNTKSEVQSYCLLYSPGFVAVYVDIKSYQNLLTNCSNHKRIMACRLIWYRLSLPGLVYKIIFWILMDILILENNFVEEEQIKNLNNKFYSFIKSKALFRNAYSDILKNILYSLNNDFYVMFI